MLPIVLYNGERAWNAAEEIGARIAAFRGELAAKRAFGILKGHTGEGLFRHLEVEIRRLGKGGRHGAA